MNEKNRIIEILKELADKSKDYDDGFLTPKECKIKISELKNYDFFIFSQLEKTKRELYTRSSNNSNKLEPVDVLVIKIENEYISFIPRIIREYLKQIN